MYEVMLSIESASPVHQSQGATELAQKVGAGHGVCIIYLFIHYLLFLFTLLFDQRLPTFFIMPPCAPFPNLFFSAGLFPLGLFSC